MKYFLLLITSAGFLLSCNQTKSNNDKTPAKNNSVQMADTINKTVKLSAEPKTLKLSALPDSIKVIMTNNTADTITTGLHYYIEKREANQWQEISPKDIAFIDLGWQLRPTETKNFEKKLFKDQINYKTGKYRIVKYYLKSDYQQTKQKFTVDAEFTITD